jgi:cyclophilin family peptidyl-prolyl cis-trans isomerase
MVASEFQRLGVMFLLVTTSAAWTASSTISVAQRAVDNFASTRLTTRSIQCQAYRSEEHNDGSSLNLSRRDILRSWSASPIVAAAGILVSAPSLAFADTSSAEVTDRIYVTVKGLPSPAGSTEPKRVVIGLFGKEAPKSVAQLKKLVTTEGLLTSCKPRGERILQREQLEANKVYSGCKDTEDVGITLRYSTIWRVVGNERIDMGAVSGRFIAREFPEWKETVESSLKHDAPGIVSVRRGNDGGFGFTIYPGGGGSNAGQLDQDHIVVGRVIDGMDVVRELNEIPVVNSAKLNYMGLTGGPKTSNAPDRSCRYGGNMYCTEGKPLVKLSITETGVL